MLLNAKSRVCKLGTFVAMCFCACVNMSTAQEPKKLTTLELADGKILLNVPDEWVKVQPRSSIVQFEFSAPKTDEKDKDKAARITVMGSGGSIEQNIDRWYTQFEQPDKSATKEKAKVEKFEADGQTIHFVDIPGTFKDTMGAGPFAPSKAPILRENHRMLGAIIETKGMGNHYLKITGPAETVDKLSEGFRKMLKELKVKA